MDVTTQGLPTSSINSNFPLPSLPLPSAHPPPWLSRVSFSVMMYLPLSLSCLRVFYVVLFLSRDRHDILIPQKDRQNQNRFLLISWQKQETRHGKNEKKSKYLRYDKSHKTGEENTLILYPAVSTYKPYTSNIFSKGGACLLRLVAVLPNFYLPRSLVLYRA